MRGFSPACSSRPEGLHYIRRPRNPVFANREGVPDVIEQVTRPSAAPVVVVWAYLEHVTSMRLQRLSLSLFGAVAFASIVLATATVWLFLTNPVTVATAVNEGDVSPLVRQLAEALFTALQGLLKYL